MQLLALSDGCVHDQGQTQDAAALVAGALKADFQIEAQAVLRAGEEGEFTVDRGLEHFLCGSSQQFSIRSWQVRLLTQGQGADTRALAAASVFSCSTAATVQNSEVVAPRMCSPRASQLIVCAPPRPWRLLIGRTGGGAELETGP